LVKAGPAAIVVPGVLRTASFIVLAPLIGLILGVTLMVGAMWLLQKAHPGPVNRWARHLQLFTCAAYSFGHGMNDAQKTMGVIAVLLVIMRNQVPELANAPAWIMPSDDMKHIPWWIVLSAHGAIALGTMSGGWRIVKTMGTRITQLQPIGGVCAELAGAITLIFSGQLGIPVSTTHTITGAIVGVGAARRFSAVRWGVAGVIIWAWVITIPAAATVAALTYGVVGVLWPHLPQAAQWILCALVAGGLIYSFVQWLAGTRSGHRPAHA
jgi:PiT family inorganic phosphate transporter